MRAVEAARRNGRWDSAYEGQRTADIPEDLQAELDRNPKAKAFFATLDSANKYAILFRIHHAGSEAARTRRIGQFVGMLEQGEKIH